MAVELVGGAFLSAFLQVTFEKLASAEIKDYFRRRRLNEKLLKAFNITLLSINDVVDDAELKQIRHQPVKVWLDAVKDVVFEAEDLLDEIDIEVSRCNLEAESQSSTITNKVWSFFNGSSSSFDKEIESKMHEVLNNLEHLASKRDILGLKATNSGFGVGSSSQVSQKLPSTSLPVDSVIYGRDVDKEVIFNWLTSDAEKDNHHLSIVSIVGMGGIGKTTLAQHLYNDPKMDGIFDVKAWVCVSQEYDLFRLTRSILEGITGSTDDSRDLNMAQERLKKKLTGQMFLLVLDDLWNEKRDQWLALQTPFKYGAQGSKVLVTTRSKKVASIMRSNKMLHLEQLEEKHCWQLFSKHAFLDENPQINPDFKEIGKKIIEKCQGSPLALKTIGSLLYTKSSLGEWESILASEIWDLPEEESNIIPALILSYHHLPSHLKRCFSYCALFPKNYLFEKEFLLLLWMAENFLQCPQQIMGMEEVGEQYFNDLCSRSFFQRSRKFKEYYVMHDLINDLARYVSGDFCFTMKDEESNDILKKTRHFSFLGIENRYSSKRLETLPNANRLHTFLPLNMSPRDIQWKDQISSTWMHELFSKCKFLRVFSLSECSIGKELPATIGNLKHLRYLDLSHTNLKKLPDSVCSLYNLQILKLRNTSLKELPVNLHKLTNLYYLDISHSGVIKMPMDMGKLKNLQVLTSFYVEKGSEANISQLGDLNLHGSLSILGLQNIANPLDALAANLKNKVHLVKLKLEWNAKSDNSEKEREVLEKLQPSKHLKELSIKSYGGTRFSYWFEDNLLFNVASLKLSNCENCVSLPPLGMLPSLKELHIKGLSGITVIGSEFYKNGSSSFSVIAFPSLKTLIFENMKSWREWDCKFVTSVFPCLEKLLMKKCHNLQECLPEQLPCLKTLKISECKKLVTSVSLAPSICRLYLNSCGSLQFNYRPSTLRFLKIGGSCMDESLVEWIGRTLSYTSLESLVIEDIPTMNIPLGCRYNFLQSLKITGSCDSLRTFPLDFFPKLESLELQKCSYLEMISQDHEHDHRLKSLSIAECPKFVSFPKGGFSAPHLDYFEICGLENLKSFPECMHTLFPSLTVLVIKYCPQLEAFTDGRFPSRLKRLHLDKCSRFLMASLERALRINTSLEILYFENVDVEFFPDQGLLPNSLASLHICNFPNLKKLNYKGLCHLSCLADLHIHDCPSLQCLPVEGLPKSISTLGICTCVLLEQRCKKPNGEDWEKISHIKYLIPDGQKVVWR